VLSKKPEHFRNFSGLTIEEFNTLNQTITEKHPAYEQNRPQRPNRKRNTGAGHPYKQTLTNRHLMLLTYYHPYTSSTVLAFTLRKYALTFDQTSSIGLKRVLS
jgi:hypothetical protein